jgi:PilZ domain
MAMEQRRHIRFSLDIPAIRMSGDGEVVDTVVQQVSIGGCLIDWDESIYTGEVFRLLVQLPNGNWLPLECKALYRFPGKGVGAKFIDITKFEQELLSDIISFNLEREGLPFLVDPFEHPPNFIADENRHLSKSRAREHLIEDSMSSIN